MELSAGQLFPPLYLIKLGGAERWTEKNLSGCKELPGFQRHRGMSETICPFVEIKQKELNQFDI